VKVWIENTYDDDTDNDIDDVRVVGRIDDIDAGDDDYDSETVDVRADSKKMVTLNFDIPKDASSYESYDLEIEACGDDQNGTEHCDSAEFDIDVDRMEHELVFDSLRVGDIRCGEDLDFRVEIQNIGEQEEWDVELKVYNNELGILFQDIFDLGSISDDYEDSTYSKSKRLDADGLSAGTHTLIISLLYDNGREDLERRLMFNVDDCNSKDEAEEKEERKREYVEVERYSNPNRDTTFLFGDQKEAVVVEMPPPGIPSASLPTGTPAKDSWFGTLVLLLGNIALIIFIVLLLRSAFGND